MPVLMIHQEKVTIDAAKKLVALCPFHAIEFENGRISINAGCKMCKLCVKNDLAGIISLSESDKTEIDKDGWKGIAVYAEINDGAIHNVTLELIGKAQELAKSINHPIYVLLIGSHVHAAGEELLHYGVDAVYVFDHPCFAEYRIDVYANAFTAFLNEVKPSSVLVGATNIGRCLAPRVAARMRTGLTADCTVLEMRENTDLIQIRPAFGGNIMAKIKTPNHRPQFCTARYKVFSAPERQEKHVGKIVSLQLPEEELLSSIRILSKEEKTKAVDIAEAEIIVACGRGFRKQDDIVLAEQLAQKIGGVIACTRPLVEAGWMEPKRQIGLSGRTVKPKLLITLGISGAIQFAAGMKDSHYIVAVNEDPEAEIFKIAHCCVVGDLYATVKTFLEIIDEENG